MIYILYTFLDWRQICHYRLDMWTIEEKRYAQNFGDAFCWNRGFQWPRGIRRGCAATRLLELWVGHVNDRREKIRPEFWWRVLLKWWIPVAALYKAWVCGYSFIGIVGWNPAGGVQAFSLVSVCVFCQVDVSATSWSLVQKSPTNCGASLWVI